MNVTSELLHKCFCGESFKVPISTPDKSFICPRCKMGWVVHRQKKLMPDCKWKEIVIELI